MSREIGNIGEERARNFLISQGYKIIETNYLIPHIGEIDIIARDEEVLAFVEVKNYQQNSLKDLHEAVDRVKQKKIINTAKRYLFARKIENSYTRFDVVLLAFDDQNRVSSIELIKDAFRIN